MKNKNKKYYTIVGIWLIVFTLIYLISSLRVIPSSEFKIIDGTINKIKCIYPTKDWFFGEVEIFLNGNNESIKYNSPILKKDNFNDGCQSLKEQIKIGKYLKAKIYDNIVGDVLIDNIKIHDGKETIASYNNDINNSIYIIVLVALYITLMRIKNIKIRESKYYKYILYIMIILAIFNFLSSCPSS